MKDLLLQSARKKMLEASESLFEYHENFPALGEVFEAWILKALMFEVSWSSYQGQRNLKQHNKLSLIQHIFSQWARLNLKNLYVFKKVSADFENVIPQFKRDRYFCSSTKNVSKRATRVFQFYPRIISKTARSATLFYRGSVWNHSPPAFSSQNKD